MPAPSRISNAFRKLKGLRERQAWVLLHRWAGLVMAGFLVVAGVTGSLLAFYDELDVLLAPGMHRAAPPSPGAPMLDPLLLLERARALEPQAEINAAPWPAHADRTLRFDLEGPADPATGEHTELPDGELYLDPYTGEEAGRRKWGDIGQGLKNLMPFIYRLHYALALEPVGTYVFGIVALLWTLDCFIGAYLTLPRGRPFWQKWQPSWQVKRKRLNFDLHRAGGLWPWAMLFVLAWSSVGFNLSEVYRPVTAALFGLAGPEPETPEMAREQHEPGMSWAQAERIGRQLMAAQAAKHGVDVLREDSLQYDSHHAEFTWWMATQLRGNGEARDWFGVSFDANTGELRRVRGLTREKTGDVVTRWLYDLHMAKVFGLPFRIFVCIMGLVVAMLSVTGIVIWWRKRRATHSRKSKKIPTP